MLSTVDIESIHKKISGGETALLITLILLGIGLIGGIGYLLYNTSSKFRDDCKKLQCYIEAKSASSELPDFSCPWTKGLFKMVVSSRSQLLACMGKTSSTGIHIAIASAKVSHFIDSLHNSIQSHQQRTNTVASATEELSVNTSQIAGSANQAAEASLHAKEAAANGMGQVTAITEGISQLKGTVTETTNSMNELFVHVQDIQGITDVIDNVAEQTNLLALNAAIEAARAGEHGRGFAVVADEVRELANKSSSYTREIDEKLHAMVAVSKHTAEEITNFQQMVELMVMQVSQIGDVLGSISTETKQSAEQVGEISRIMNEHLVSVNQISQETNSLRSAFDQLINDASIVSTDALKLSDQAETIYEVNAGFEFGTFNDKVKNIALDVAKRVGELFERAIADGRISQAQLFDRNYVPINGTNPQKFRTEFDKFTDEVLPAIQEPLLEQNPEFILAGAVDNNGYFPTHNKKFSRALTGKYDVDLANNRTKRIFNDRTGARCGSNTETFLLQTYKRDTGEIMHDLSAPIYVKGRHWGGFRIGYMPQEEVSEL